MACTCSCWSKDKVRVVLAVVEIHGLIPLKVVKKLDLIVNKGSYCKYTFEENKCICSLMLVSPKKPLRNLQLWIVKVSENLENAVEQEVDDVKVVKKNWFQKVEVYFTVAVPGMEADRGRHTCISWLWLSVM